MRPRAARNVCVLRNHVINTGFAAHIPYLHGTQRAPGGTAGSSLAGTASTSAAAYQTVARPDRLEPESYGRGDPRRLRYLPLVGERQRPQCWPDALAHRPAE